MRYITVDIEQHTLEFYPKHRDWSDMHNDKHFDYHLACITSLQGQPFVARIYANQLPWSAILHTRLFVRILKHVLANNTQQIKLIEIVDASYAALVISKFLLPMFTPDVYEKIRCIKNSDLQKKLE